MKWGAVLLVAMCALTVVSSAQARHRMTFEFAQMVAADYWQKRGVTVSCHPREHLLSREETAGWDFSPDMVADVPACMIDVTPWAESWRVDPFVDEDYCWEVAHEVGHLAGLEHVHDGSTVMDPDGAEYPYGCTHPRKFLRRRARLARR